MATGCEKWTIHANFTLLGHSADSPVTEKRKANNLPPLRHLIGSSLDFDGQAGAIMAAPNDKYLGDPAAFLRPCYPHLLLKVVHP